MIRYRTPLRYPGGKQKLAPFISEILTTNDLLGGDYAEPYAGGAGVAIHLLLSGQASRIHLNDACHGIYAFWRSLLKEPEAFCRKISGASMTVKEWRRQKLILSRPKDFDQLDVGFSMFFLNRCNRSGIPNAGVIGGIKQNGKWKMDARFPRNDLIHRVESIAMRSEDITVRNWDAEKFLTTYIPKLPKKSLVYCDPPYYHKADRLYFNHYKPEDHVRIAQTIQKTIKHPWIVSYDGVPEVVNHYSKRTSFFYQLQYNASKAYKGKEVFFFSDNLDLPSSSSVKCVNAALVKLLY